MFLLLLSLCYVVHTCFVVCFTFLLLLCDSIVDASVILLLFWPVNCFASLLFFISFFTVIFVVWCLCVFCGVFCSRLRRAYRQPLSLFCVVHCSCSLRCTSLLGGFFGLQLACYVVLIGRSTWISSYTSCYSMYYLCYSLIIVCFVLSSSFCRTFCSASLLLFVVITLLVCFYLLLFFVVHA